MIRIFAGESDPGRAHDAAYQFLSLKYREIRGVPAPMDSIMQNPNGKPYFSDDPGFQFSISHSGDWAVVAVSDVSVGVDIQLKKPISLKLAGRFFTKNEQRLLASLEGEEYNDTFYRIWTAKEAICKVRGDSLVMILCRTDTVAFDGTLKDVVDDVFVKRIDFPDPGFALAVASEEDSTPELIIDELSCKHLI